jgi:hypothetical protein
MGIQQIVPRHSPHPSTPTTAPQRQVLIVKRTLAASALLLALVAATTGCTTGGGTASPTKSDSADTVTARTYDEADLKAILLATQKSMGVDGKILTDKEIKAASNGLGTGAASLFGGAKVKYNPAACGDLVTTALAAKPDAKGIGSALTYDTTAISLVTEEGATLPAEYSTDLESRLDDFLAKCGKVSMNITTGGISVKAALSLTKIDVKTTADTTFAIQEGIKISGLSTGSVPAVKLTIIQARSGNLFVSAAGSTALGSTGSVASLTKAVDTALAAAAKLK